MGKKTRSAEGQRILEGHQAGGGEESCPDRSVDRGGVGGLASRGGSLVGVLAKPDVSDPGQGGLTTAPLGQGHGRAAWCRADIFWIRIFKGDLSTFRRRNSQARSAWRPSSKF